MEAFDIKIINAMWESASMAEAARRVYMSRSALLRRVVRIEQKTGLNARIPRELYQLKKLICRKRGA